jgi:hypothetical protein
MNSSNWARCPIGPASQDQESRSGEDNSDEADSEESGKADDNKPANGAPDGLEAAEAKDASGSDAAAKAAVTKGSRPAPSGPQDRYIAPEMQSYTPVFRFGHDLLVRTTIGKVPYKLFLIDTGSVSNFISPVAAREVTGVQGDAHTTVKGISGTMEGVYRANKAVLRFGHLRQENQDMLAFDTKPISDSVGTEISGFLGFVLLRLLDIKMDYRDALVDFQYDPKRFNR